MALIIDIQTLARGSLPARGKLYLGPYNGDPINESVPVWTDPDYTTSILSPINLAPPLLFLPRHRSVMHQAIQIFAGIWNRILFLFRLQGHSPAILTPSRNLLFLSFHNRTYSSPRLRQVSTLIIFVS